MTVYTCLHVMYTSTLHVHVLEILCRVDRPVYIINRLTITCFISLWNERRCVILVYIVSVATSIDGGYEI